MGDPLGGVFLGGFSWAGSRWNVSATYPTGLGTVRVATVTATPATLTRRRRALISIPRLPLGAV